MAEAAEREWMTTAQACAYLGVGRTTLWRMRQRKTIPCARDGGVVRYRRSSLDKAMARRETMGGER